MDTEPSWPVDSASASASLSEDYASYMRERLDIEHVSGTHPRVLVHVADSRDYLSQDTDQCPSMWAYVRWMEESMQSEEDSAMLPGHFERSLPPLSSRDNTWQAPPRPDSCNASGGLSKRLYDSEGAEPAKRPRVDTAHWRAATLPSRPSG